MYSTHSEGKSFVAERFIRTLKGKMYTHMAVVSKHVYIERLDDIVDKYNKTYRTIKKQPVNIQPGTCIDYGVEHNDKDPKFKISDHEYQITKIFLQRATLQIGLRNSL